MTPATDFALQCPLPLRDYPVIVMAHGGGGRLMHQLLENIFWPAFQNPLLAQQHDGAVARMNGRVAFTTDSYVVRPLFFPGGDIGTLAINGTVNDLAMCGARPQYLSAGFILEEGLPMETLWRVVQSMKSAAAAAQVQIVTGDIKVVDKGMGDGLFINTAGIGCVETELVISPSSVRPGDVVLLSGDVGRHGIAIMGVREGLSFESPIESDCGPLVAPVRKLLDAGIEIHCLRDLTRGGLATTLAEIAGTSGWRINLEEAAVPVEEGVKGACEMLGFDPMYVANEGRFLAIVAACDAERALDLLRTEPICARATRAGQVLEEKSGLATLKTIFGSTRILDMLSGEQLPRIC